MCIRDSPEVEGIMGWCQTHPIVIENREQAEGVELDEMCIRDRHYNNSLDSFFMLYFIYLFDTEVYL